MGTGSNSRENLSATTNEAGNWCLSPIFPTTSAIFLTRANQLLIERMTPYPIDDPHPATLREVPELVRANLR